MCPAYQPRTTLSISGAPALALALTLANGGAVESRAGELRSEGTYTLVGQSSGDETLRESMTGSLDLYFTWQRGRGRVDGYVEANNSLRRDGVATRLPRSNADAGTALDADRSGRIQLSELRYTYEWPDERVLSFGLLDATAHLDASRINNDENVQFLGASFVNNPTIDFPDYTVGLAAQVPVGDGGRRWTWVVAASNGLADNPEVSYNQLLEVTADGKGVFAGAETSRLSNRRRVRTGAWINTADHDSLDGSRSDVHNYGAYATLGSSRGAWAANLRLGVANPDVSFVAGFASIGAQRERGDRTIGLAVAHSWISPEARAALAFRTTHVESYVRFRLTDSLCMTPSIQYFANGGFDSGGPPLDDDVIVYSLRIHHAFSMMRP